MSGRAFRRGDTSDGAFQLFACGIAVACLWVCAASIAAIGLRHRVLADSLTQRHTLAIFGAIGVPVALVLMLVGVERMPGALEPAMRWNRRLDVALMTPAIFLTCWLFTGELAGGGQIHLHPTWTVLTGAAPVVAAATSMAFAVVLIVRATHARLVATLLGSGVAAVTLGGTGTVAAILGGTAGEVLASGCAAAVGFVLLTGAGLRRRRLVGPLVEAIRPGWAMPGITVSVALVLIVLEVRATGSLDPVGAVAGVLTGFAMIAWQGLALADANRLSRRLKEDEVHLRDLAYADALTGVANRRELLRVLHQEAVGGPPCVLLAIDLDGFKNVNDLRGHDVGDAVLVEVAQRLRMNIRPGDIAARMGGDEFAVLVWATMADATTAAQRLLSALGQSYQTDAGSVFVSASIGLASCASATDIAGLLRNADLALRFAKQRGKDRVELYDVAYDEWLRRRTAIEHELRGAVIRDELSLAYQPIVTLPGARPVGVEALLRWNHPKLGPVPPNEFIPIAEEAGIISQLDRWVLHQACRQLNRWLADGHELWIAVNISARELRDTDYVGQVVEALRTHRIPPELLVLEITEHAVAQDVDGLVVQLDAVRKAGIRVALDDFGAGYSSLGQLRRLPVDILKIDRCLVGNPARGSAREVAPLVDVVVRLGRRLNLQVIAEGVALPAERTVVQRAGCLLGQGDLFGRAMPAEHLEALLTEPELATLDSAPAALPVVTAKTAPARRTPRQTRRNVQDVGLLDSGHEMRQS